MSAVYEPQLAVIDRILGLVQPLGFAGSGGGGRLGWPGGRWVMLSGKGISEPNPC